MQYSDDPDPEDGAGYDNGFDDNWEADEAPQDQQPDDGYNQYDEQYNEQYDEQYDQDGNQYDDQDGNQYDDQYYDSLIQQMQDNDPILSRANFVDMRIGDVGAEDIAASLEHGPNTNVVLLDCGQNDISEKGFEVLLPAVGASRIRHLWLRGNYMGPQGAAVLADMLAQNETLVEISVGKNQVSSTGAADIASALTENNTLTALWMYSNEIGDDGAAAISDILSQNETLTE